MPFAQCPRDRAVDRPYSGDRAIRSLQGVVLFSPGWKPPVASATRNWTQAVIPVAPGLDRHLCDQGNGNVTGLYERRRGRLYGAEAPRSSRHQRVSAPRFRTF